MRNKDIEQRIDNNYMENEKEASYNTKNYINDALKTESGDFKAIKERLNNELMIRLLHGTIGLQTETAEFSDQLKKHLFYGKSLDYLNLLEELSDIFWYCAIIASSLGEESFDNIMKANIAKLKARFPEKFNSDNALNRNTSIEMESFIKAL